MTRANNNGNGFNWKWNATKEVGSFAIAELTSIAISVGVFTFIDEVAPGMMKNISQTIGKVCIEPYLDVVEKGMKLFCRSKDCQVDPKKPRSERAEAYARYLTRFGLSVASGIGTEPLIRSGLNKWFGVNEAASNLKVIGLDKAVHLGALFAVNTVGARQTDAVIDVTSDILQKTLGWSPERSKKAADVTIRWEAANAFSSLVAISYMVMRQFNKREMHL